MRTSGEINSPPGQPNLQGEERKAYKKRSQNWASGFSSLRFFWIGPPSWLKEVFSFACQIKLSCNRTVTLVNPPLQIFAAARQNWGNYKPPQHYYSHFINEKNWDSEFKYHVQVIKLLGKSKAQEVRLKKLTHRKLPSTLINRGGILSIHKIFIKYLLYPQCVE